MLHDFVAGCRHTDRGRNIYVIYVKDPRDKKHFYMMMVIVMVDIEHDHFEMKYTVNHLTIIMF